MPHWMGEVGPHMEQSWQILERPNLVCFCFSFLGFDVLISRLLSGNGTGTIYRPWTSMELSKWNTFWMDFGIRGYWTISCHAWLTKLAKTNCNEPFSLLCVDMNLDLDIHWKTQGLRRLRLYYQYPRPPPPPNMIHTPCPTRIAKSLPRWINSCSTTKAKRTPFTQMSEPTRLQRHGSYSIESQGDLCRFGLLESQIESIVGALFGKGLCQESWMLPSDQWWTHCRSIFGFDGGTHTRLQFWLSGFPATALLVQALVVRPNNFSWDAEPPMPTESSTERWVVVWSTVAECNEKVNWHQNKC
jgi:hypothetical protein